MENNPYEVDVKTIQSFKTEDYTEYEKMFKSMDTDKSGFIEKGELLKVMHNLGYRSMVEEDLTKILAEIDLNKDQKVSFKEYLMMMKKVKGEQGSTQEAFTNKAGKEFIKVGTDFSFQSFSVEERTAFTKVINTVLIDDPVCKKYLPIDPNTNELFTMLKNGIILCI